MLGIKQFVIGEHERGVHMENRSFRGILSAGVYRFVDPFGRHQVQVYDLTVPEFNHPQLDVLLDAHAEELAEHVHAVAVGERQVGLVYRQGALTDLLAPATRAAYWKGPVATRVEVLDIEADFRLGPAQAALLARPQVGSHLSQVASKFIYAGEVPEKHVGLLIVEGGLVEVLKPGLHAFWRLNRSIKVEVVDTRMQAVDVQGQEILTKDKVTLRVNLAANYRVSDPVKARAELGDIGEYLYRTLQFGLRQAVSARTLEVLLSNKGELDRSVHEFVNAKVTAYGLTLESVGVRDVILPGDMKEILNRVVEAEKVAEANVIRRREETAATRSLLNTAKLMDENPTLRRLKELETLEKVTEKVGSLTVFNGLDGVLQDTVRINLRGG